MLKQFTFLLILSYSSLTQAAAWLPEPGHGTAIIGALAYSARAEFQSDGSKRAFGEDGRFTKKELYYYLAYSLTKDWGLIASGTMLNELSYENDFGEKKFSGAGDQYLAGRYFLTKNGTGAEVIQAGVTLPAYSDSADPTPGNGQNDFEFRYLRDHFQIWGPSFFSWEIAYRYRNSAPSDQLRVDLTFGKNFESWIFMVHANAMKGLRNQTGVETSVNPNTPTDFDLYKLGASVAFKYDLEDAVQLGLNEDVFGRKTGKGRGLFLSWWKGF